MQLGPRHARFLGSLAVIMILTCGMAVCVAVRGDLGPRLPPVGAPHPRTASGQSEHTGPTPRILSSADGIESLKSTAPAPVDVFVPTGPGTPLPCFRQPALVVTEGYVLAFAELRNNTDCSGTHDGFPTRLVLRRSGRGSPTRFDEMQFVDVGNGGIDFYAATWDETRSMVHLMVEQGGTTLYLSSTDEGNSWSAPSPLTVSGSGAFAGLTVSVGHGIVVIRELCNTGCSAAGRVVVPFICHSSTSTLGDKAACPTCHSCVVSLDPGATTWTVGAAAQTGSRESAIAQVWTTAPGTAAAIYANQRNMGDAPGHRMVQRSSDCGATWGAGLVDSNLPTPVTGNWTGIVAGMARLSVGATPTSKMNSLVFSSPVSTTRRANMTVRLSHDEGLSWSEGVVLHEGPAAYSDLYALDNSTMGIIFENGDATFADRISFAALPVDWMEG